MTTSSKSPANSDIAKLTKQFESKLPKYIEQITDVWQSLDFVNWNPKVAQSLQYFCHRLAGSAATYGFDSIGNCVKHIEQSLQHIEINPEQLTAEWYESIRAEVLKLNELPLIQATKKKVAPIEALPESKIDHLIYVVDDDEDSGLFLTQWLKQAGFKSVHFTTIAAAITSCREYPPTLVFMDINFPEGRLAGIEAIERIRSATGYRVPVIIQSARQDMKARIEAVNHGCDGYLSKPLEANDLKLALEKTLGTNLFSDSRVLIVEDDTSTAMFYLAALRKMGVECEHISNPLKSLQMVREYKPDLILLDNIMPNCNGIDLAKIFKQDPKLISTGIIFITGDEDLLLTDKVLSLGVNGFLKKPVSIEQLQQTVREYLVGSKQFRGVLDRIVQKQDNELLNSSYFFSKVESQLITENDRYHGLLMISIKDFKKLQNTNGLAKSSRIVSQLGEEIAMHLPSDSLATQYGTSNFLVLLSDEKLTPLIEQSEILNAKLIKSIRESDSELSKLSIQSSLAPTTEGQSSLEQLITRCEFALKEKSNQELVICKQALKSAGGLSISASDQSDIEAALQASQYSLLYQPIYSIESDNNNTYFFDTFVRLNGNSGKTYTPADFFPLVDDRESYHKLDRFVLEQVITKLHQLNKSMRSETFIQAHLTEYALTNRDTLIWVSNMLNETRIINRSTLVFEFSERSVMKHKKEVLYFAKKLETLKCGLAITDVGNTSESLALIKQLSPAFIKFNANTFAQDLNGQKGQFLKELIRHVESHSGMVVACQIEAPQLVSQLYAYGVKFYQGYFMSHPDSEVNQTEAASFEL